MPTNASFVTPFTPPPPWVLNLYIHIIYCILNDWRQNLHAHRETYYNICVLGLFIYMGNPILSPNTNDIWIFWRFFCSFTPKSHPMIHGSQLVLHRLLPLQTRTLLYKRHVLKINEIKCSKFGNHHGLDMIVNIMWGMMMGGGTFVYESTQFWTKLRIPRVEKTQLFVANALGVWFLCKNLICANKTMVLFKLPPYVFQHHH